MSPVVCRFLLHALTVYISYLRALERRQDGLPSPGSLRDGIRARPRHSSVSDFSISAGIRHDTSVVEADGGEYP